MRAVRTVGIGALLLGATLACGGVPLLGGAPRNVAACQAYREAYNALPCSHRDLPEEYCPPELDGAGCDYPSYYACLERGLRCNGEYLDVTGQLGCEVRCR